MGADSILPSDPVPVLPSEDFSNMSFDFTPDEGQGKIIFTIHGLKGASKTYGAFLITTGRVGGFHSGKTLAISFDKKTKTTKDQWFPTDNIVVHDGKKYYKKDPKERTRSGNMSYYYLQRLMENEMKIGQPDWIIMDGFTELAEILEMSMRYINGLKATQGFSNRNIWKDRGAMIQQIHDVAVRTAKVGVIYTTYSDKDDFIVDGRIELSSVIPKYVDVVMRETDVVIRTTKARTGNKDLFYLKVDSTKFKNYLNLDGTKMPVVEGVTLSQGRTFNITDLAETKSANHKPVPVDENELLPPQNEVKKEIPVIVQEPKPIKTEPKVTPKFEAPNIMDI